ncbi:HlyD family efflux transporter periplasmic adaptor subunit [Parathalassolituus penaei]|uniref:Biotin/lipoyl-binding protein n=1 Tax=Parathalassolituus penaei TaxID=2997323 RepID=A0A9X3EGR2_9GAMM|nr:HlyD family efflux transporter periplasmic adaptor subunit [Parathalassolituus penaei]MCY0966439.1 biotin/lipoyl-binding protein [Parathalassolituus penaei]
MTEVASPSRSQKRNKLLVALGAVVLLSAGATATWWQLHGSRYVSTDNAYTATEIATVTPAVSGIVAEVLVQDTQSVKAGDVLVRIDQADARLAVAQAEADLARVQRQVAAYYANDKTLAAQVAAAEAAEKTARAQLSGAESDFERARIDLERRQALVKSGSISGDELTRAENAFASARAALTAANAATSQTLATRIGAQRSREANAVQIINSTPDTHPEVLAAQVRLQQAQLDLERTEIRAAVDGIVANRSVQPGQRIQAGTSLLSIVPVQDMHVDANFKEGQLEEVRIGQPVIVTSDLYGDSVTYHGVVEGLSAGSGSAFATIPAQNATGNWIKVVQRLPLRIRLDQAELAEHPLRVGLSMEVTIDTHAKADGDNALTLR